jgi:hypothetical protein
LGTTVAAETLPATVTNFFTMKLGSRAPFIDYSGETITKRSRLRFGIRSSQRISNTINMIGARGGVVVKALRYKPVGRGFDSR